MVKWRSKLPAMANHPSYGTSSTIIVCLVLTSLILARLLQSHRSGRKRTLRMEGWYLAARGESLVLESLDEPRLYVFKTSYMNRGMATDILSAKMSISPFL